LLPPPADSGHFIQEAALSALLLQLNPSVVLFQGQLDHPRIAVSLYELRPPLRYDPRTLLQNTALSAKIDLQSQTVRM
jgi:hypothetical protein